ncbi:LacI family DNA-binding transcriptional regulator [Pedobacter arcticus]|uniref:LacI family DNA-binding transcriptional regulator n=1 Tax=Pedobacter arcticus TaxID=752140 RepID=UPI000311BE49|nr:LacI family DNA-binding transcriptional regulator [Pedobacter arcticus]
MKNVTLKHLASKLGLSVSTVSRALTDSYEINVETKKRVKALAEELNYQPNPFAAFLRKHISKTIALIIPEISNNFFSLVIKGVETICAEKDYYVLIYETHEDYKKEVRITNHLIGGRVDGVLISVNSESDNCQHLQELVDRNVKMVMFDRVVENFNASKVYSDDYDSSFAGVSHLVNRGCKRILFLKAGDKLSTMHQREKAYFDVLEKNNLPKDPSFVKSFVPSKEIDLEDLTKFIVEKKPDAIFCSVERLAIGCYDICNNLGLNIPNDIKIITFSCLNVARLLNPSLSTISQPAFEIGKTAARLLLDEIEGKNLADGFANLSLPSTIIKRDSTRKSL